MNSAKHRLEGFCLTCFFSGILKPQTRLSYAYSNMFFRFKICLYDAINGYPAGNCMFKVNNRNTRTRCEICSMLTIKTPERTFWCLYC